MPPKLSRAGAEDLGALTGFRDSLREDRGTVHHVWRDSYGARWQPFLFAVHYAISVPIGWSLRPDPQHGVVLASTFGERLTADQVLARAIAGEGGFRLRRDSNRNASESRFGG